MALSASRNLQVPSRFGCSWKPRQYTTRHSRQDQHYLRLQGQAAQHQLSLDPEDDQELLHQLRPHLQAACTALEGHMGSCKQGTDSKEAALAAVEAAEASGAIPKLAEKPRELLRSALARAAAAYWRVDEAQPEAPGKSEWPELSDDELVFTIKPLAREVYELLVSDKASDA